MTRDLLVNTFSTPGGEGLRGGDAASIPRGGGILCGNTAKYVGLEPQQDGKQAAEGEGVQTQKG